MNQVAVRGDLADVWLTRAQSGGWAVVDLGGGRTLDTGDGRPADPAAGRRVLVALGAAHGFKFAPLLGRVLADLALHDGTDVDIAPFAPGRAALTASGVAASYLV